MRLHILLVTLVVLTGVGCGSNQANRPGATTGPSAASTSPPTSATTTPSTTRSAPVSTTGSAGSTTSHAVGPVWPIEPRTVRSIPAGPGSGSGVAVLRAIRTGRQSTYERLVLEFSAPYGSASVSYVPVVRADPSDTIVPLRGTAFLQITVHGAVAAHQGVPITPYDGPTTLTPGYPTMKQVSITGDVEAVLSFGVGLGRIAGFRVTAGGNPSRIVVDVADLPDWQMWPEMSLSSAREVQAAFDQGHQPWRGDPVSVVRVYAQSVYRISDAVVTRDAATGTYRVSPRNSPDGILVRVVRPFGHGICEIADTR